MDSDSSPSTYARTVVKRGPYSLKLAFRTALARLTSWLIGLALVNERWPLHRLSVPSYNTPPYEAPMPFSIHPFRRFPVTMLSLNTLTKMAKALKVTVVELAK